jgi:hypothetical protein
MLKYVLFTLAIMIFRCSIALGQGNWELKRNENGIEVYTRKPASGNLKELRVVCKLKTTKAQLIKTLQDINNYKNWVYSTKTNKVLNIPNAHETIYYSISNLPWPLKDRDLIVQLTILPAALKDKFEIQAKSLPDYLPIDDNFIRVPYSLALWNVTILNEKELNIDYTFSVNPGGSVPAWLVNSTLAVGPYNSFLRLRELLSKSN